MQRDVPAEVVEECAPTLQPRDAPTEDNPTGSELPKGLNVAPTDDPIPDEIETDVSKEEIRDDSRIEVGKCNDEVSQFNDPPSLRRVVQVDLPSLVHQQSKQAQAEPVRLPTDTQIYFERQKLWFQNEIRVLQCTPLPALKRKVVGLKPTIDNYRRQLNHTLNGKGKVTRDSLCSQLKSGPMMSYCGCLKRVDINENSIDICPECTLNCAKGSCSNDTHKGLHISDYIYSSLHLAIQTMIIFNNFHRRIFPRS